VRTGNFRRCARQAPRPLIKRRSRQARIAGTARGPRGDHLRGPRHHVGRAPEFGIEHLEVSDGALRQGVLYDLLGRVRHRDMREATVRQFATLPSGCSAEERVARLAQNIHAS